MSGHEPSQARPLFDTGHLTTFKTPQSSRQSPSHVRLEVSSLSGRRSRSPNASARAHRILSSALADARGSAAHDALMQKLISDEHAVAAQNMTEIANRRDISILKLSEMCSQLRADLESLERENAQLSKNLQASEDESLQLRLQLKELNQRYSIMQELERSNYILQQRIGDLQTHEHHLSSSLKGAELERDDALNQLQQSKLQTAAANESARHATILMQAMELDLTSSERNLQNLQDMLTIRANEFNMLQEIHSQLQRDLDVFKNKDAEVASQVDSLNKKLAESTKALSMSDSEVCQLRLDLQLERDCSESLKVQLISIKELARSIEEESSRMKSMHTDELSSLRNRIISNESVIKEQQSDISSLISARNDAQVQFKQCQLENLSLEKLRVDLSDKLQAQMNINSRFESDFHNFRDVSEIELSNQKDYFHNQLTHERETKYAIQAELESLKQQSTALSHLCSNHEQTICLLTHKLEISNSERIALEIQSDSFQARAHSVETSYSSFKLETDAQILKLSNEVSELKVKLKDLQLLYSGATSQITELSNSRAKAIADLELKEAELKSIDKQARAKSQEQSQSYSLLQGQYLQLQHELSETTHRLQQRILASEQSASGKTNRIRALEEAISVLQVATSEAQTTIPFLQNKLCGLSEENSTLRSQILSNTLMNETSLPDNSQDADSTVSFQNQIQEKDIQSALLQQTYEHRFRELQQVNAQLSLQLQQHQELNATSIVGHSVSSLLPLHASKLGSALGTLKGQVKSLRQSYNDEIQALWVSVGKSMEAILSISVAESSRNRAQMLDLHQNFTVLSNRNSDLEAAISKDTAVYEASKASLIFERVKWESKVYELQCSLSKAECGIASMNDSVELLKVTLSTVNSQLLGQQLRMAGLLATICPLYTPNDQVLSTLTDGFCPNVLFLRLCSKVCCQHNPAFSAALLSQFDFTMSDSINLTANQSQEFHEFALKLSNASVAPSITSSLQLIHSGLNEAIRLKSQSAADIEAQLFASKATISHCETSKFRLEQVVAELKGQLQSQSLNFTAMAVQNANLKHQLHEFELRLERQAAQFEADSLLQKKTNEQALASYELQASSTLSALQEKLVQVHAELEKLRARNREENARARADAIAAYERGIQDVTNESFAESSNLASFIESSVAEALSLEQSTMTLQTRIQFET